MKFLGIEYTLNQCDELWMWYKDSRIGEYTSYYDKLIFHAPYGFIAAYKDNLKNHWKV